VAAHPPISGYHDGGNNTGRSASTEAWFVGTVEDKQPQPLRMSAEMLVEPDSSHGRGANHPYRLVGLPFHLVAEPRLPRLHAEPVGPRVTVALAFDADEDG